MRLALALILFLPLVACGPSPKGADAPATSPAPLAATPGSMLGDPVIAAAINQPIMADPGLSQSSNIDAIRPPSQPDPISMPPDDLGALPDPVDARGLRHAPTPRPCPQCMAARQSLTLGALAERRDARCAADVRYTTAWAGQLPPALPVYPNARLVEAAGSDANGCRLRVVSFATAAPVGKVIDWYFTRASAAHLSAAHQAEGREHLLSGAGGGMAYMTYATARADGGTDVRLLVSGR